MKVVVDVFDQKKARIGAFSVIFNLSLSMDLRSSSLSQHQLAFISRHLSAAADTADIIVPRSPPSSSALRAAAVLPPGEVTSS